MSETDSFIAEVTEDVRRDRLFRLFRRYGWIPALAIVAIVSGTAYNEWAKTLAETEAQNRGDRLLAALEIEDDEARKKEFNSISFEDSGNVAVAFLVAGMETDQSVELLKKISKDPNQSEYIRELGRLKLTMIPGAVSTDEAVTILTTLSEPGNRYRAPAMELLIAVELQRGNKAEALALLQAHIQDAGTSRAQMQRMAELIVALGETPNLGPATSSVLGN